MMIIFLKISKILKIVNIGDFVGSEYKKKPKVEFFEFRKNPPLEK